MPARRPPFLELHGLAVPEAPRALPQAFSPPYRGRDVRLYEFLLPAAPASLARFCDTAFNGPSGGAVHYEPLLPFVLLSFVDIGQLSAIDAPQADIGWFHERDAVLWFLARATAHPLRGQAISGVPVYAFVDQPQALITGREVEGWPKEWSTVTMGRANADPGAVAVSTVAVPAFGPLVQGLPMEIMRVSRVPGEGAAADEEVLTSGADILRRVWSDLGAAATLLRPGVAIDVVEEIHSGAVPLTFLKQFRDAADGSRACHQSVVEVPMRGMNVTRGGLLPGRYAVWLAEVASHPIAADLGLDRAALASVRGFWLDFDFVVERGVEVWSAQC
jgi:hypothetical protein